MWKKMYNGQRRTYMICEATIKKYCSEDISKIENYDKAIADKRITWHCHHRLEVTPHEIRLKEQLKSDGLYYNRPASELIFLTPREHNCIHGNPTGYFEFRPVAQFKGNDCVGIHLNPLRAACDMGGNHRNIIRCCENKAHTHLGYAWRYL